MDISDFLTPARIVLDLRARSKPSLLAEIARMCLPLPPDPIEAALLAREELGSTGLGDGFALPHARLDGLSEYLGFFVRLARPIEFQAIDGKPVRLVFALLIPPDPTTPHVAALAAISRRLRKPDVAAALLKADTKDAAFNCLTGA